jgi:hypothetical protein
MSFPDAVEAKNITINSKTRLFDYSELRKRKIVSSSIGLEICGDRALSSMYSGRSDVICCGLDKKERHFFESKGYKVELQGYTDFFDFEYYKIGW